MLRRKRARFVRALAAGAWTVVAAGTTGCDDLSRFRLRDDESYCGAITLGSAFRVGLAPGVAMRLRIDPDALDGAEPPGTLDTFEARDDGPEDDERLFVGARLRPLPAVTHDPLSRLQLGEGRERNALFAVSPADPAAEAMLALVSFKADDSVEVRLLRPGVEAETGVTPPARRRSVFGVFSLTRTQGTCGF